MIKMNIRTLMKSTKKDTYSIIRQRLTKRDITDCLSFYGFVECARMSTFLSEVVDGDIDIPSYRYLLACLNNCLHTHARGYNDEASLKYFRPLFNLRDEIEFITSIA